MTKTNVIIIVLVMCLSLLNAVNITDSRISSSGLNSTIVVLNFSIEFDKLSITDDAIIFYNLSYTNPLSCKSASSFFDIFNYTTHNMTIELPYETCDADTGSSFRPRDIQNQTNITSLPQEKWFSWININNQHILKILLAVFLIIVVLIILILFKFKRKKK